jgi:AraC family transcriptional regulator, L-rhamnose operon regulatory protein RhaS
MEALLPLKDFDLIIKDYECRVADPHKHSCFELIYVLKGAGLHLINGNKFPYKHGSLFLLTPDDLHGFETEDRSTFCIIDFTRLFLSKAYGRQENNREVNDFYKRSEYIFHNHNREKGEVAVPLANLQLVEMLIQQILTEKDQQELLHGVIVENIVFLLLNWVARYIYRITPENKFGRKSGNILAEMTAYIHEHIYDKELLTMERIARHFNKSKDYISIYFKRNSGNSLKDYIIRYKLELIKTRLIYSDLTIAEIAWELDFTDESHLNKIFKKHFEKTAKAYRKNFKRNIKGIF